MKPGLQLLLAGDKLVRFYLYKLMRPSGEDTEAMRRKLRLEFPEVRYHVINLKDHALEAASRA